MIKKTTLAKSPATILASLLAVILLGSSVTSTDAASRFVTADGDVWDYDIYWFWSSEIQGMKGRLIPEIIINPTTVQTGEETATTIIEGAIVDPNTKDPLTVYDEDSIVLAQFGYDSGISSDWDIAARPSDGSFTITVPEKHQDADWVGLQINGHSFLVLPASLEDHHGPEGRQNATDSAQEKPYFTTNNSINITLSETGEMFYIENAPTALLADGNDENDDNAKYPGSYQTQIEITVYGERGTFRLT